MNVQDRFPLDDPITKVSTIWTLILITAQSTLAIRHKYTILGYRNVLERLGDGFFTSAAPIERYIWTFRVRSSLLRVVLCFPLGIPRHGSVTAVTVSVDGLFFLGRFFGTHGWIKA